MQSCMIGTSSTKYYARDQMKDDEWVRHVRCMGQKKNAHEGLVGNCEGKRPLQRPRRKWEDDIKIHFKETG